MSKKVGNVNLSNVLSSILGGVLLTSGSLVHLAHAGGSNNGGGLRSSHIVPYVSWCNTAMGMLAESQSEARVSYRLGLSSDAIETLIQSIENALDSPEFVNNERSALKRILERVHAFALLIQEDALQPKQRIQKQTLFSTTDQGYVFLDEMITQLISEASNIEQNQFQCLNSCSGADFIQFELRFARLAQAQLNHLNQQVTQGGTVSLYKGAFYLKFADFVLKNILEDLNRPESLFKLQYQCVHSRVAAIQTKLSAFNSGNNRILGGDPRLATAHFHNQISLVGQLVSGLIQNQNVICK